MIKTSAWIWAELFLHFTSWLASVEPWRSWTSSVMLFSSVSNEFLFSQSLVPNLRYCGCVTYKRNAWDAWNASIIRGIKHMFSQVNVPWGRRAQALIKTCGRIVSSRPEWAHTTSERPPGTDDYSSGRRRCTNTGEVHIRGHHRDLIFIFIIIIIIIIIISQKRTGTVRCSPGWPWWTSGCSAFFASWCRCGSCWTCRSRINTSVVSLLWSTRPFKDKLSKRKSFFF